MGRLPKELPRQHRVEGLGNDMDARSKMPARMNEALVKWRDEVTVASVRVSCADEHYLALKNFSWRWRLSEKVASRVAGFGVKESSAVEVDEERWTDA
jgi:hypothetical protein